jgi:hypothetical protein
MYDILKVIVLEDKLLQFILCNRYDILKVIIFRRQSSTSSTIQCGKHIHKWAPWEVNSMHYSLLRDLDTKEVANRNSRARRSKCDFP